MSMPLNLLAVAITMYIYTAGHASILIKVMGRSQKLPCTHALHLNCGMPRLQQFVNCDLELHHIPYSWMYVPCMCITTFVHKDTLVQRENVKLHATDNWLVSTDL